MRNRESLIFRETYQVDRSTHRYIIGVGLEQYTDAFSRWDPSSLKHREIDPDLEEYLEKYSDEIPSEYPIELSIELTHPINNEQIETEVKEGLKNHFILKAYLLKREIRKNNKRALTAVFIGVLLLGLATLLAKKAYDVLPSVLIEGINIAGWVFVWEAVSLCFFSNRDIYHRYWTYKRLGNAPLFFPEKA